MERERRTFQLQMCEVGGLVPVKIPAPDTFHIPGVGSVRPARVVFLWGIPYFYPRSTALFRAPENPWPRINTLLQVKYQAGSCRSGSHG